MQKSTTGVIMFCLIPYVLACGGAREATARGRAPIVKKDEVRKIVSKGLILHAMHGTGTARDALVAIDTNVNILCAAVNSSDEKLSDQAARELWRHWNLDTISVRRGLQQNEADLSRVRRKIRQTLVAADKAPLDIKALAAVQSAIFLNNQARQAVTDELVKSKTSDRWQLLLRRRDQLMDDNIQNFLLRKEIRSHRKLLAASLAPRPSSSAREFERKYYQASGEVLKPSGQAIKAILRMAGGNAGKLTEIVELLSRDDVEALKKIRELLTNPAKYAKPDLGYRIEKINDFRKQTNLAFGRFAGTVNEAGRFAGDTLASYRVITVPETTGDLLFDRDLARKADIASARPNPTTATPRKRTPILPTIRVKFPTSRTVWRPGMHWRNYHVDWSGAKGGKVRMELYKNGVLLGVYHPWTSNDGHAESPGPKADWGRGSGFQIKVIDAKGNYGLSDVFTMQ